MVHEGENIDVTKFLIFPFLIIYFVIFSSCAGDNNTIWSSILMRFYQQITNNKTHYAIECNVIKVSPVITDFKRVQ